MADEEIPMEERGRDNDGFDDEDEDEEQETSFGGGNVMEGSRALERGERPKTKTKTKTSSRANPSLEVELGLGSDFERRENRQDEAKRRILERYPDWDPEKSRFVATINDKDQVTVSLIKGRSVDAKPSVLFNENGTLRSGLSKKIIEDLGKTTFKIVDTRIDELRRENEGLRMRIEGEKSIRKNANHENMDKRKKLREKIKEGKAKISDLEDENKHSNEEEERLREENDRLRKEKDEELKRAKENNEAEVGRLKNDYEVHGKERDEFYEDKMSDLKRNYEERIRGIMDEYGREMSEKDKRMREIEKQIMERDDQLADLNVELINMQATMEEMMNRGMTEVGNKASYAEEQRILEESEMKIEENEERIEELTRENEATLEKLSLKERVKLIFKKYGVTALGITTAVGTVIGVVVSNLKSGLAKVAKGVGDGLKELGKKLAQRLPGMIGAIAKYVFDTAGEVIGYLAKNTWLLIVAAVVYAVEQFKKNK